MGVRKGKSTFRKSDGAIPSTVKAPLDKKEGASESRGPRGGHDSVKEDSGL